MIQTLPDDLIVLFRIVSTWGSVVILEMFLFVIVALMPSVFLSTKETVRSYACLMAKLRNDALWEFLLHLVNRRRKTVKPHDHTHRLIWTRSTRLLNMVMSRCVCWKKWISSHFSKVSTSGALWRWASYNLVNGRCHEVLRTEEPCLTV